ncbi:pyridoxamine 5'-phosphate oxidase family protein [Kineosporia babensis]|uniref:Pyridoxamine 5'-phosphate oxidase family protein n=1 Tax=Kineosporia babensis TaxID=499548 RepID=A0A9X1NHJ0_9ACTN|nr:pyridoxamine 5'-phosphate oxidase family protein [Kineosporia babensis]MCD5313386.1 pyridoxamine 5'-phosphate oxidase family protein [Kineosporia babensis]
MQDVQDGRNAVLTEVTSVAALREIIGEPIPRVAHKVRHRLEEPHRQFLAASPFLLLGTSAADGSGDVSPKGDPAGFVQVLDDTTIAIPERAGNRRVDGYLNILGNPQVGLLFLVPGRDDTMRINGHARIVSDGPFFDAMVVKGHRPVLALVVDVEEIFFHCSKAFLRSQLWHPETWEPEAVPSRARIAHQLERSDQSLETVEAYYNSPSYAEGLYPVNQE